MEEVMKIQIIKKEEECENLEEEVVALKVEVKNLNKNLKSSQVLEDILNCQRSPFDKSNIGYIGEENINPSIYPKPMG